MLQENAFPNEQDSFYDKFINRLMIIYRNKIDRYIIYPKQRWAISMFIILIYLYRILSIGGFYVVSYILGLYILHLSVQFFTPLGIPDSEEDEEDDKIVCELPISNQDNPEDTGPLIRSMSEFKFWQNCTLASFLAVLCTSSEIFDLPVFWPFLLAYFIMLFALTLKRQFKHMSKYKYGFLDFTRKSKK